MMDWLYPLILAAAVLVVLSVLTSVLALRFGTPLLLIFLSIGLLAGEDGLGIQFDNAEIAYLIGSLALAVILFDSGFGTSMRAFRQAAAPAVTLATVGVVFTTGLVGVAAHYVLGLPWLGAFLIGAIVSSTDAAAVFFLLRVGGITIKERVRSTLEIESGSNDPMAIFLTVALVELIATSSGWEGFATQILIGFVLQMGLGLAMGIAGGFLLVQLVNRIDLEAGLYPVITLAAALTIFGATGQLGGSGFLAVYVAGLLAGNMRLRSFSALRRFQDGMTWLAQIVMFVTLGLLATPSAFPVLLLPAVALALFLMFIARPLAIWLCLLPFGYRRNETAFVGWVGLRGAVSILLAILPFIAGLDNAQMFFNVAFIIVLTSLLVQGWTIPLTARRLGLIVPTRIGPVEKVELELPGTAYHELVAYHVVRGSAVLGGARLPRWARPSLVIRGGRSMRYQQAGRLKEGDYVYIFMSSRHADLLDRLFASPASIDGTDPRFFGHFSIDPSAPMRSLREKGVDIPHGTSPAMPIRNFVRSRLRGHIEVGDRVGVGDAELVVRHVDADGAVTEIGVAMRQQSRADEP